MRRRVLIALVVGSVMFGPTAAAQVVVPSGGTARVNSGTGRTERTPGAGRTPGTGRIASTQGRTERTPGTPRTPGTGRTPGTPRTGGTPRSLPRTGLPLGSLALDALTLVGAGAAMTRFRRRMA